MKKFELLEHTADIKFRACGSTMNGVFENSALALASYLSDKPIKTLKSRSIFVSGTDKESLLNHFLDEILYLIDAEHFIAGKAKVNVLGCNLKADLYGDDSKNYKINQVKAATYAEMEIKKIKNGFQAIFVVDV